MRGRIVRAGDLDAAISLEVVHREVEHRGGPAADPLHVDAAGAQALDHRLGQIRRAEPAIHANAHPLATLGAEHGRKGAAKGERIRRKQRFVHNTADVVLAQDARMKPMAGSAGPARRHAIFLALSPLRFGTGRPMLL